MKNIRQDIEYSIKNNILDDINGRIWKTDLVDRYPRGDTYTLKGSDTKKHITYNIAIKINNKIPTI